MADRTEAEQPASATLHAAISHAVVGLLREYTGRGPMKSRTTIRDNVVLVMLDQTLTKGEQSLVNKGRGDKVIEIRPRRRQLTASASQGRCRRGAAARQAGLPLTWLVAGRGWGSRLPASIVSVGGELGEHRAQEHPLLVAEGHQQVGFHCPYALACAGVDGRAVVGERDRVRPSVAVFSAVRRTRPRSLESVDQPDQPGLVVADALREHQLRWRGVPGEFRQDDVLHRDLRPAATAALLRSAGG